MFLCTACPVIQRSIIFAGKMILKDAMLTMAHGRHYGLVGRNGKA